MRIAMFTNNYKPYIGGVPISIERLAQGLRDRGHQVYIFAPVYSSMQENEEFVIRYHAFSETLPNDMVIPKPFDSKTEKIFKKLSFDLIHVHHPVLAGNTALQLGEKYGIPVVFTYHTRYEEYLHNFKFREKKTKDESWLMGCLRKHVVPNYITSFTNHCDLVFAPTQMMKEYLLDRGTETEIKILPTGLDEDSYIEDKKVSQKIRQTYLKDRKHLLCTVSRLDKEKNFIFFLNGVKQLKAKLGNTFCLLIIGDGAQRKFLEKTACELDLAENVVFLGSLPNREIKHYQYASDLFLFASKSETQGIVLLEAMAAGSPVVAVEASGVVDIVKNGENGFMTREDAEEWAFKAQTVLEDCDLYERLSQGARKTADCYRSRAVAEQAESAYLNLLMTTSKKKWEKKYEKMDRDSSEPSFLRLFKNN